MAKNLLDDTFYIQSKHLKLIEPLMVKYFDFDLNMFLDLIKSVVERKCDDYITYENGIAKIDYLKTFYEHEELFFSIGKSDCSRRIIDSFRRSLLTHSLNDISKQY